MQTSFKQLQPPLTDHHLLITDRGSILLKLLNKPDEAVCVHPAKTRLKVGEIVNIVFTDRPVHGQVIIEE